MSKNLTIEEMYRLAKLRGGSCLSKKYVNARTNLEWQCKEGHVWQATPDKVKHGSWCPFCAHTAKLSIKEMCKIAESRGGECLSEKYVNARTNLEWQCKEGHVWQATPDNIKHDSWCPLCGIRTRANKRRLGIDEMRKIAKSREGECLSEIYTDAHTKLRWRCKEGHEWNAVPSNVKNGQWCPICGGTVKLSIEEMHKLAKLRGGACVSDTYVNNQTKLLWRCKEGHEWTAIPSSIKQAGTWCPHCSDLVTERICRKLFEYIFDVDFPCKKPSWLIKDTGHKLELDGYNETLGLAFEYQGEQHYKYNKFFHRKTTLNQSTKHDEMKKVLCERHNVRLIAIPHSIKNEHKFEYIISECKKQGILPPTKDKIDHYLLDAYSPHHIQEMRTLAKNKGGACISETYLDARSKLKWRCKEGHVWEATPDNIKHDSWCPFCAHTAKLSIKEMCKIAESRGGECLSEAYANTDTKIHWRCKEGHEWWAIPNSVKKGSWCPLCGIRTRANKRRLCIDEMRKIANSREGECLSDVYVDNKTKLLWRCKERHEWTTTPNKIKSGHWCPRCARVKKRK